MIQHKRQIIITEDLLGPLGHFDAIPQLNMAFNIQQEYLHTIGIGRVADLKRVHELMFVTYTYKATHLREIEEGAIVDIDFRIDTSNPSRLGLFATFRCGHTTMTEIEMTMLLCTTGTRRRLLHKRPRWMKEIFDSLQ